MFDWVWAYITVTSPILRAILLPGALLSWDVGSGLKAYLELGCPCCRLTCLAHLRGLQLHDTALTDLKSSYGCLGRSRYCWAWRLLWCFHWTRRRLGRCWSSLVDVEKSNLLCKQISLFFFCQKLELKMQRIFVALCMTDTDFIVNYFLMSFCYGVFIMGLLSTWFPESWAPRLSRSQAMFLKLSCTICFLKYSTCFSHIMKGRMAAVQ